MESNNLTPLTVLGCYCFIIAANISADGEGTTKIAAGLLVAHDLGVTAVDAVGQIDSASAELASSSPEKKQHLLQCAVAKLKQSVSPEDLTTLYFRLETLARANGFAEVEQESFRRLRSDWEIPDSAYDNERRKVIKANRQVQKSGCAIFLLAGLGLVASGCSLLA
jgi:hypothetical protein